MLTEREWQALVIDHARHGGWTPIHFPHVVTAHAAGWPDLVLIRAPALIFVELKSDRGRLSPAQSYMLAKLEQCGLDVRVWRPSDHDEMRATLARSSAPSADGA